MISVVIIEDEYLIRERIKKCIDWTALGFEIIGEACNGDEAMNLVEKLLPDIAIVDINMPFMNGLEFSKAVNDKKMGIKIVILTGYSNFDYAREALKAGAVDYLLKPVDEIEITRIMTVLKSKIELEKSLADNFEKLKIKSQIENNAEKDKFMQSVFDIEFTKTNGVDTAKFKTYFPELDEKHLLVVIIGIDNISGIITEKNDYDVWMFAVKNIIEEYFGQTENCCVTYDFKGRIAIVLNIGFDKDIKSMESFISICRNAQNSIIRFLGFSVSIGIGGEYNLYENICFSYKEAVSALKNKIILGNNSIIEFSSLNVMESRNTDFQFRKNILISLRMGDIHKIQEIIHEYIELVEFKKMNVESIYIIIFEFNLAIQEFINEKKVNLAEYDIEMKELINPWDLIERSESLQELDEWLCNKAYKVLEMCTGLKISVNTALIDEITRFINSNYMNFNLNLDMLARNVFMNPSYISSSYKKDTGISLTEKITEVRMIKAKEILDAGNTALDTVANLVGYNDPYYFSKCFKKYFGVSVSKYIHRFH